MNAKLKFNLLIIIVLAIVLLAYPPTTSTQGPQGNGQLLARDALPIPSEIRTREAAQASASSGFAPGSNRTSDFMLGRIVVGIVLPESNGHAEDWTTTEKNFVRDEVIQALNWWQGQATARGIQHLEFIVPDAQDVPTSYEPIQKIGLEDPDGDAHLWINDVMNNLGYSGQSHIERVRAYANDLRQTHNADWAFVIFMVDGPADGDGLFAPGSWGYPDLSVTAWAYIPGPYMVANNYSAVATNFGDPTKKGLLDEVIAHETGHIFGAADEVWADGGHCTTGSECDAQFGYLSVENQNCDSPSQCSLDEGTCVMRVGDLDFLCPYSAGQVGWQDSDSDNIPDPIDTTPTINITQYPPSPTTDLTPTYTGIVEDNPLATTHPDYEDLTINDVEVQFRVNGGSWSRGVATDGAFDSPSEAFTFSPLFCQSGQFTVEARAINSVGNTSNILSHQITANPSDTCRQVYLPIILKSDSGTSSSALVSTFTSPPSTFTSPIPPPAPLCDGQVATIWVHNDLVQGGQDDGQAYRGELKGTNGDDIIVGTDEADTIRGRRGNDLICSDDGNDTIRGGGGNDTLFGEDGKDKLFGNQGHDVCTGGRGKDQIRCEEANE